MRVLVGILEVALTAGVAQAGGDQVAVYGYVAKVVPEPSAERPERVQIWGTFSVAAPGPGSQYQAPEHGYLYFEFPADSSAGFNECSNLKSLVGKIGIVTFGARGMPVRVRTADEPPDHPTPYSFGNGVELIGFDGDSAAVQMLGRLPKTIGQVSYGLIDKVVVEPDAGKPERIQIWGVFAIGDAEKSTYAPPSRGYLYFTLPSANRNEWKMLTGNSQVVGFRSPFRLKMRLRNPEERPDGPDVLDVYRSPISLFAVRPDTEYAPVRSLLAFR